MISVIIPTYNRANVLAKTLPTYFSEFVNEIIIVDDGSKDNTEKVVFEYLSVFRNIKYVRHKKNLGLPIARNEGIKSVSERSEYIFFGEDDVFLIENCYKTMLEVLQKNNLDVVSVSVKYLSDNDDYKKYISEEIKILYPKDVKDILKFSAIQLGKKEVYNDLKFDSNYILNSYREETDFFIRAQQKYKIALIENYLAFNLPRSICGKGGEWDFNPFVYEFATIYNNFRFLLKNKKFIKMSLEQILVEQTKFTFDRLRALKAKIIK